MMVPFLVMSAVLCVLALYLVLPVLVRSESTDSSQPDDANLNFLRSRLDELADQLKLGKLSQIEYEELKEDLEANLAAEIQTAVASSPNTTASTTLSRTTARSLIVLIPVIAGIAYYFVGSPQTISQLAKTESVAPQVDMAEVQSMIEQIESRLIDNPNDLEGWTVLARTYLGLGRYANAERAYLQVLQIQGPSAATYAALADASALANEGQLVGRPIEYIGKALELDASHPQALWLAGLHAVQVGDNELGKKYWQTLLPLLDQMPERQTELRDIIAQMDTQGSIMPPKSNADEGQSSNGGLNVRVVFDDVIASRVSETDTVFIIVRASDGPRAPLAVKRFTVGTLPDQITLSDADAMMANASLSSYETLIVFARVSKSGQPMPQSGDLTSESVTTTLDSAEIVNLTISREI